MMKIKDILDLFRETFREWSEDKAPRLAAALSYYTIFAIPPLLVVVIGIVGVFLGRGRVKDALLQQIGDVLPAESAEAIDRMIDAASVSGSGIAALVGILVLLLGASGIFSQLQDALNTIFEVRPKPGQGIGTILRKRFFSFLMVLALGFLLLVSLVLSAALAALAELIGDALPGSNTAFQWINFLLPLLVIAGLFALMFKYMPDVEIAWRDVWPGAILTSLLFNIGKTLLAIYLARTDMASTYGAAASVILIFVWIYYTAQILFIGAEFTQVYATRYGKGLRPEPTAEFVTEGERDQQGLSRKE